jgi:predicted nucleic acid-binding protein
VIDKVVDASALAAVAFKEPKEEAAKARLHGHRLCAPFLLSYEMANVCSKKMARHPADRKAIFEQLIDSHNVSIELHDVDFIEVVELANRHNLTAYDASYLWLARRLGTELVTLDERLGKAAATPP